jgi:hypothetical protein
LPTLLSKGCGHDFKFQHEFKDISL